MFMLISIVSRLPYKPQTPHHTYCKQPTTLDPWQKETLGLKVGDIIIWKDEAIELEGQPALVAPGMRGEVLSLHDGFHLDVVQVKPIPPRAIVQFDNGTLMVDARMNWEKAD